MTQYTNIGAPRIMRTLRLNSLLAFSLAFVLVSSSACSKKDNSSFKVSADYLHLTGTVTDPDLQPVPNAILHLPGKEAPLTFADDEGNFSVTISDKTLKELQALWTTRLGKTASQFRVIFSTEGTPGLAAISGLYSYSARGERSLSSVILEPTVTIYGQVNQFSIEGDVLPATGLDVFGAHRSAKTGVDGKFTLENLPLGTLNITTSGEETSVSSTPVTLEESGQKVLEAPIVVFPTNSIGGWVTPLPAASLNELNATGHPFQRSFTVSHAPLAKLIRFHHDKESFENKLGDGNWQAIERRIDYDFPGNGGHNLYVQFANGDKSKTSRVLTIQTEVNIFPEGAAISIGDGSGLITNRLAQLIIDRPALASRMRIQESLNGIEEAPWVPAADVYVYQFARPTTGSSSQVSAYLQFADAQGNESLIYSASAILDVFPPLPEPVVTIEGGIETTSNRVVSIDIEIPQNAVQMTVLESAPGGSSQSFDPRLGSVSSSGGDTPWYPANSQFFFTFEDSGLKTIYVQFRDVDGLTSPLYTDQIRILPFDPLELTEGFVVNGGSPVTSVREVSLSLLPPTGAVAYRVRQGQPPINQSFSSDAPLPDPWLTLENDVAFVLEGQGASTIYMDFRDLNGDESTVYQQTILFDPFSGSPSSVLINGGSGFTDEPILLLDILPPVGAVEMAIVKLQGEVASTSTLITNWQTISTTATFLVEETGSHTIGVKFRNINDDESPYLASTIVFDPFPAPFGPFTINGGSASTTDNNLALQFLLFPNAYEMTVTTDPSTPGPWLVVETNKNFVLPQVDGLYTIYTTYRTIDGHVSPTFTSQIQLNYDPFPAPFGPFTIDNGATTTTNQSVTLDFQLPPNAVEFTITTDSSTPGPWLAAQAQTQFTLPVNKQTYTIFVQYRTANGALSSTFTSTITYQ